MATTTHVMQNKLTVGLSEAAPDKMRVTLDMVGAIMCGYRVLAPNRDMV